MNFNRKATDAKLVDDAVKAWGRMIEEWKSHGHPDAVVRELLGREVEKHARWSSRGLSRLGRDLWMTRYRAVNRRILRTLFPGADA